jgi:hypothetical protein
MSAAVVCASSRKAAAAVIPSTTIVHEAMFAPAMAVAPTCPRSHAQEDAVVEVSRPVEAHGGALVRRVVVVTVGANGLNAQVHDDLRARRWRHGQSREQS